MHKYKVKVILTVSDTIEVEAENEKEAKNEALNRYYRQEVLEGSIVGYYKLDIEIQN